MCLLKIRDVMHLYAMWSAALQGDVERFAVDYEGDNDDGEAPSCLTNSALESHFKSVKHGRLERRSRVRSRAFVTSELTYVLWKLNDRKLPKERIQKREPASAEEKWRRRKRPPPAMPTRLSPVSGLRQSQTTRSTAHGQGHDDSS